MCRLCPGSPFIDLDPNVHVVIACVYCVRLDSESIRMSWYVIGRRFTNWILFRLSFSCPRLVAVKGQGVEFTIVEVGLPRASAVSNVQDPKLNDCIMINAS